MGNPALTYDSEPTPCSTCSRVRGWGWTEGEKYIDCDKNSYFRKIEQGCKHWTAGGGIVPARARRVIVCGGRDYRDVGKVWKALDAARAKAPIWVIVHSGGSGLPAIAHQWALDRRVLTEERAAQWNLHGDNAEQLRDDEMIAAGADGLIAFPGAEAMVQRAEAAGIPVWRPFG